MTSSVIALDVRSYVCSAGYKYELYAAVAASVQSNVGTGAK